MDGIEGMFDWKFLRIITDKNSGSIVPQWEGVPHLLKVLDDDGVSVVAIWTDVTRSWRGMFITSILAPNKENPAFKLQTFEQIR